MVVKFKVFGEVLGKQRPRAKVVGKFAQIYTPEETVNYENLVKMSYRQEYGSYIYNSNIPLSINIQIYKSVNKSFYNSKGLLNEKGRQAINGELKPINKPDVDNCAKLILDALNTVAYPDDKQVVELLVSKRYDVQDYVQVSIAEMGE
jgi:Holliday junction resolvase RusA-like endonuclease